jgi:hypothetical protein
MADNTLSSDKNDNFEVDDDKTLSVCCAFDELV